MMLLFSLFPVILLVYLMVKPKPLPAYKALPLSAFSVYLIVLIIFKQDPNLTHAHVFAGLLKAWTPILIVAGAIFLFKTLEFTGGLDVIRQELNSVSQSPVAQLMIVGWAFPFLIEGASGFGTPAAIAAPILVGLGFNPLKVAVLALIMNSVPVSFGAVGTPTWFGFSTLGLSLGEQLDIGFRSAVLHGVIAIIIPLLALKQLVSWRTIFSNMIFIQLSIASTVIPYLIVAKIDFEFPSLIGGSIGLLTTIILAKYSIGLNKHSEQQKQSGTANQMSELSLQNQSVAKQKSKVSVLFKASFPIWGTLLLLLITRLPDLGLKTLLTALEPAISLELGSIGSLTISASAVFALTNIFGTETSWQHSLLYVPSILPFGLISLLTLALYQHDRLSSYRVITETFSQMKKPSIAMFGALVFVSLMMLGGNGSAVSQIGMALADVSGNGWLFIAPFLGALGSFFSGSATISNLTFGGIQNTIATNLMLDKYTILALQSVGGALGNMVCINNIVAVCSVLAISNKEGAILKQTIIPALLYAFMAGTLAWLLMPV